MLNSSSRRLEDFQQELIEEAIKKIRNGSKRILLQLFMGGGKTFLAARLIRLIVDCSRSESDPFKVLFLVDLDALLHQAKNELELDGLDVGIYSGLHKLSEMDKQKNVFVSSIQSLEQVFKKNKCSVREALRDLFSGEIGVVISDECHDIAYRSAHVLMMRELSEETLWLGLTATPFRLNPKQFLGEHYTDIVVGPSPKQLIDIGRIVRCRAFGLGGVDLSGIGHDITGDFDVRQMSIKFRHPTTMKHVVGEYLRLGQGRTMAAYCCDLEHMKCQTQAFLDAGIPAKFISGDLPPKKRAEILSEIVSGRIKVICSVGTMTKGWNEPSIGGIILALSTESEAKYLQIAGRGSRSCKNVPWQSQPKSDFLLLDFGGNIERFGVPDADRAIDIGPKPDLTKTGQAQRKLCPMCGLLNFPSTKKCPCGHVFAIASDLEDPKLIELKEYFSSIELDLIHKYRQTIFQAYKLDVNPKYPDLLYTEASGGRRPRKEFRMFAVFGVNGGREKNRDAFARYLVRHGLSLPECKSYFYAEFGHSLQQEDSIPDSLRVFPASA